MRILITGGTGYIGRAVCTALSDHELTVYSRHPERVSALCGENVTGLGSLMELPGPGFDAVINLAGEPIAGGLWTSRRKQRLQDSRIGLTRLLCQQLSEMPAPPGIFVSASAVGYYGDGGDEVLDEASAPNDEFAHRLCADWEAAAGAAADWGARVVKLRIGLVMGPGGGFLAPLKLPFRLGLGGRLGTGDQWMSWISLVDMVRVIEFALTENSCDGIYNACTANPVTNAEFTRSFAAALRRPAMIPVPAAVLRLLLGEMSRLLLTGQRVVPAGLTEAGFTFEHSHLQEALQVAVR